MAQLPTSFSAPHSNISDGSDLIRAAMGLNRDINEFGNKAFSTVSKFATQQANQALANTFASNIANGMDPTAAMSGALGKVNSWTSADAINNLLTQRNYEQESLRKEALLNIDKAKERRAMQNWLGENEAAEANLLLDTGFNTNNSSVYNQGLSAASKLTDIGKKYVKMHNLAKQQDDFASSATSRGYTKALTNQLADKKLASRLDADFKMIEAQNPYMTKAQVAQQVGAMNGLPTEEVTRQLNMHQMASGQSILTEMSTNLSPVLSGKAVEKFKNADNILNTYDIDTDAALSGKTDQNIADRNLIINALSGELSGIDDFHPTKTESSYFGGSYPVKSRVEADKARELISGILQNPSPENLKKAKEYLKSIESKGKFTDFLDSNFMEQDGKVILTPKAVEAMKGVLGKQIMPGGNTRNDLLATAANDKYETTLPMMQVKQAEIYRQINQLTKRGKLTPEEQIKLQKLNTLYNEYSVAVRNQQEKLAKSTLTRFPVESLNQTIATFGEKIDSGKQLFEKDLTAAGMSEETAKNALKRLDDVIEEAQSKEEYKDIPLEAIKYAVLNKALKADSWFYTDTDYLKLAKIIAEKLPSKKEANSLINLATKIDKENNSKNASETLTGQRHR